MNRFLLAPLAKPILFLLCLLPFGGLVFGAVTDQLGANPAQTLVRDTGDWTLRFLCLVLALTPMRVQFGWMGLARFRRMCGLFVYFYATLHFLGYAWLDMGLDPAEIALDIAKRPFILVGVLTFLLLTPLAASSFNRAVRFLGGARWRRLHRLVYGIAILAILHFFWMRASKNDLTEVAVYASLLTGLLGWRVWRSLSGQRDRAAVGRQWRDAGVR